MEDEHGPLLGLESAETPLKLLAIRDRTRLVTRRGVEREGLYLSGPSPQLPALIRARVHHQAIEPGVEPVGIAQRGKLLPGPNQGFLHRILREGRVPKDETSNRVEAISSGGREDFEGLVVSATGSLDEISPHSLSISGRRLRGPGC